MYCILCVTFSSFFLLFVTCTHLFYTCIFLQFLLQSHPFFLPLSPIRACDRVRQNLGNCAPFSCQIVRHKRPIVRQKWSIMRQIVRFFRVILILFLQVLEEKNTFLLSTSNLQHEKEKILDNYF